MTPTLFIGGSIDGTRREVDAHVDRVQVPRLAWTDAATDHYRRVYLPTHRGERRSFFLLAGMDPEDALRHMLEHYHPGEAIGGKYCNGAFLPDVADSERVIAAIKRTPPPLRVVIILPPKAACVAVNRETAFPFNRTSCPDCGECEKPTP